MCNQKLVGLLRVYGLIKMDEKKVIEGLLTDDYEGLLISTPNIMMISINTELQKFVGRKIRITVEVIE